MYCDNIHFCIKWGFENFFKLTAHFLKFHKIYIYQTDSERDSCLSLYIHYIVYKYNLNPQFYRVFFLDIAFRCLYRQLNATMKMVTTVRKHIYHKYVYLFMFAKGDNPTLRQNFF